MSSVAIISQPRKWQQKERRYMADFFSDKNWQRQQMHQWPMHQEPRLSMVNGRKRSWILKGLKKRTSLYLVKAYDWREIALVSRCRWHENPSKGPTPSKFQAIRNSHFKVVENWDVEFSVFIYICVTWSIGALSLVNSKQAEAGWGLRLVRQACGRAVVAKTKNSAVAWAQFSAEANELNSKKQTLDFQFGAFLHQLGRRK